jgi:hypothetical protein
MMYMTGQAQGVQTHTHKHACIHTYLRTYTHTHRPDQIPNAATGPGVEPRCSERDEMSVFCSLSPSPPLSPFLLHCYQLARVLKVLKSQRPSTFTMYIEFIVTIESVL